MNGILRKFGNDIKGILWLSLAVFVGLSLWSYAASDPSLNSASYNVEVSNYCGYVGSFLADLLYQGFGLAAWVVVFACLRMALQGFTGEEAAFHKMQFFWGTLLILVLASLMSLYYPEEKIFNSPISVGGVLGFLVTQLMIKAFNFIGVSVVLWSAALVLIVFYTQRTLLDFVRFFVKLFYWMSERVETMDFGFERTRSFFKVTYFKIKSWFSRTRKTEVNGQKEEKSSSLLGEVEDDIEFNKEDEITEEISGKEIFFQKKKTSKRKVRLTTKTPKKVANWMMPKLDLLDDPPLSGVKVNEKEVKMKAHLLSDKLEQFSVQGEVVAIRTGPAVTMFEFKPEVNVPVSKITKLENDLSLALSSESVRIIAPIPGRDVVGIETSNSTREIVYLKDVLAEKIFWSENMVLPLCLGRQANGEIQVVDFRKMPHLLVAGSTGSGKSVFTVSCITGLIMRHSPETMRLIMIDPKQVDLAAFEKLPHLLMPPIYEAKKAVIALRWVVNEMEKRYRSLKNFGVRKIEEFNDVVGDLPSKEMKEHEQKNTEMAENGAQVLQQYYYTPQPYIVVVVEEFGDLMSVEKADIEHQVVRLAQKARAAGIHLFLAMQSPRKDVVTGLIKTNIPGRVSFKVASKMDSRIILDDSGAERLLAQGDMLFLSPGLSKPRRHHGPWLSDKEISRITRFWSDQSEPEYDPKILRVLEGRSGAPDEENFGIILWFNVRFLYRH